MTCVVKYRDGDRNTYTWCGRRVSCKSCDPCFVGEFLYYGPSPEVACPDCLKAYYAGHYSLESRVPARSITQVSEVVTVGRSPPLDDPFDRKGDSEW